MDKILYLLVIFNFLYTPFGIQLSENGITKEVSKAHFLQNKVIRSLAGSSKHGCLVDFCKVCSQDYKVCELCEDDCIIKDYKCEKKSGDSSEEISLAGIIAMVVSLSLFSVVFFIL